jgi:hypothetical protein
MSPSDLDRVMEVMHRFDEFILEPKYTGIWCGRCSRYVVAGVLTTRPTYQVARCECRTEVRPIGRIGGHELPNFTQMDWDILNDWDSSL